MPSGWRPLRSRDGSQRPRAGTHPVSSWPRLPPGARPRSRRGDSIIRPVSLKQKPRRERQTQRLRPTPRLEPRPSRARSATSWPSARTRRRGAGALAAAPSSPPAVSAGNKARGPAEPKGDGPRRGGRRRPARAGRARAPEGAALSPAPRGGKERATRGRAGAGGRGRRGWPVEGTAKAQLLSHPRPRWISVRGHLGQICHFADERVGAQKDEGLRGVWLDSNPAPRRTGSGLRPARVARRRLPHRVR